MPFSTCCARAGSRQALDQTELCAHSTAHDRFQEWVQAGVFLKVWQAGIEQFDELCGLDWDWLSMDGAMRHLPRWAGEKTGPNPTDRGKSGVKRSLLTEGHGLPIGLVIEGANRHEMRTRASDQSCASSSAVPSQARSSRKGCAWTKATTMTRCAISCMSSALPPIFAHEERRPKPSGEKRASKRGAGWWSGHIRG